MQKKHILMIGGVTALFGACVIREEPLPPPQPALTPAAAPNVPPASAIESIANARCDLALRCNRIGPYSEFMTRDHCLNLMRTRGQQEIRDCPQGVDQRALDGCMADIASQSCAQAYFHGVDRFTACSDNSLCYPR